MMLSQSIECVRSFLFWKKIYLSITYFLTEKFLAEVFMLGYREQTATCAFGAAKFLSCTDMEQHSL